MPELNFPSFPPTNPFVVLRLYLPRYPGSPFSYSCDSRLYSPPTYQFFLPSPTPLPLRPLLPSTPARVHRFVQPFLLRLLIGHLFPCLLCCFRDLRWVRGMYFPVHYFSGPNGLLFYSFFLLASNSYLIECLGVQFSVWRASCPVPKCLDTFLALAGFLAYPGTTGLTHSGG